MKHGQAPRYLADNLIPASDAAPRRLHLYDQPTGTVSLYLAVDSARMAVGAFDYVGPTVWNSLPDELRDSDSFDNFK